MKKLFFPALLFSALFFAGRLDAQLNIPQPYNTETYKKEQTADDSVGHIILKPTILQSGATLFVDRYRRQPFVLDFFNAGGARIATYQVRDNSFYINTSGWGRGIYFYRAEDAFHPFIDAGRIIVL
ncbi:MAG: hypothetical protein P4L51_13725 [Puia sp.]|nr:hypothetical protein [Puia sp.]